MPAVVRLGDVCTGHGCFGSRPNVQGSSDTFVNGLPVHRQTDGWASHCCGLPCHSSVLAAGSAVTYVNGLQLGRVGDPVACGSACATGSPDTSSG
jgi:uncharacterized Zn-binding protein involved in type VI secretion